MGYYSGREVKKIWSKEGVIKCKSRLQVKSGSGGGFKGEVYVGVVQQRYEQSSNGYVRTYKHTYIHTFLYFINKLNL